MKQNIDVLNTSVAAFRSSVEIILGFRAEAIYGNSSNKGDSK